MKKLLAALLMVLTVTNTAGCSGNAAPDTSGGSGEEKATTFKIGHMRPAGSPADIALNNLKDEVSEATDGTLTIEIYPASQLGDYAVLEERVSIGDVEMQMATLGTSLDKSFGMASAPYLATTWEEAYEIFNGQSEFSQDIAKRLAGFDIKLLGVYPLYFGGMALDRLPDNVNSFDNKGIKIRVPSMKCYEKNAEMLGYIPTPLAFSDTFTAMQTGVVNGVLGSGAEGCYGNFRDLTKYYLAYNDHFEVWYIYVNQAKFDSLSERQQNALVEAASKLEETRWEIAQAETAEYERLLEENGTTIIRFTDDEINAFKEKCAETVWPEIKHDYDGDLFDRVTSK